MKISLERDALLTQLQTVTRVASTRSAIQALSGVQVVAGDAGCGAPRDRHGCQPRGTAAGGDGEGGGRRAARASAPRRGPLVAGRPGLARAAARRAGRGVDLGRGHLSHPHASRRGLSAVPRAGRRGRRLGAGGGVHRDRAQGRGLRVARRDPPGAHRNPGLRGGTRAADGRDRLVPAQREGDSARGRAGVGVRGQRSRAGASGAGACGGRRRGGTAQGERPPEPGRVPARRRRALLAADRRAVPELPPAAARVLRARAADRRRAS